jgi:hypothetical protein
MGAETGRTCVDAENHNRCLEERRLERSSLALLAQGGGSEASDWLPADQRAEVERWRCKQFGSTLVWVDVSGVKQPYGFHRRKFIGRRERPDWKDSSIPVQTCKSCFGSLMRGGRGID